ncbi:MAG TPA: AraC family transcriptional regulator [Xanthobacteraceae bacterium]|nr:AraC family transcriptional regulator [Xanthobacteraceae bacterium]
MKPLIFSSSDLPLELTDEARFARWRELYNDVYCAFDQDRIAGRPFAAKFASVRIGSLTCARFDGTVNRYVRTQHHVARDPSELFGLSFHRGPGEVRCSINGNEIAMAHGEATLFATSEVGAYESGSSIDWTNVAIPRDRLVERVPHPEDLLSKVIHGHTPAVAHLRRYLEMVVSADGIDGDPGLATQVETMLLDLVVLALGGRGDGAEIARTRGLRAARTDLVLAEIGARFADPGFSVGVAARKVGISVRSVQELLHATGTTFAERILELRLQKARRMLADRRNDHLRLNEVALDCGFNEVTYFHRCFRRRFGASPTQYRGGPVVDD